MSTRKLVGVFKRLREIDHVDIIRIGTKCSLQSVACFNDPALMTSKQFDARKAHLCHGAF